MLPGGHGDASLLPHPRYSAVPTGCEQMVTKLTGCKQLRRGTRYCLHAFSFGNKRCLPAQKVCCGTLPLPLFLDFFLKALRSSSHRLGLKSIQLSGLPAHNFFHSEKGKMDFFFFSADSPLCSWNEKVRTAVVRGTTSTQLFQRPAGTPFPAKSFLPGFLPSNLQTPRTQGQPREAPSQHPYSTVL